MEEEQLIHEAGLKIRETECRCRKEYPFDKALTYWDADEARVLLYEKPVVIETDFGENIILAGRPEYCDDQGRLVFDVDHIVTMQFMPKEHLRCLVESYQVFRDLGPIKWDADCAGLRNIKTYCSRVDDSIRANVVYLSKTKQIQQVYTKLYEAMGGEALEDRLLRRVTFLKSMVLRYKENKALWKPEMYRLKLF